MPATIRIKSNQVEWVNRTGRVFYSNIITKGEDPTEYQIEVESTKTKVSKLFTFKGVKEYRQIESWRFETEDGCALVLENI